MLATIIVVVGIVMAAVGVTTYAVTVTQLRAQQITVASVTPENPGRLAGKRVSDPFTALAEINAIAHHTNAITGGKTYGELGNVATSDGKTYSKDLTVAASTDGQAHTAGEALSAADAQTYSARATAQQSSFLRASIYVSVLAFGISALIIGLGIVVALIGWTMRMTLRQPATTA